MLEALSQLSFENTAALWLLLGLPLLITGYLRFQKHRWQQAMRFSMLSVVEHLKRQSSPWKRLLGPCSALLLITLLILAVARPVAITQVASRSVDMMLVMDISLSMMASDIKPNRITAAREAAIRFVESLPNDARIGLELFAGDNWVVTPPTRNHKQVVAYLRDLSPDRLQQQTQLGSAIQSALNVLSVSGEDNNQNAESVNKISPVKTPQKVMILLSDGDSQSGYPWAVAANNARAQNVTIHTVGIGSANPTTILYQGMQLPVSFDESTLVRIAQIAGGEYFRVFSEKDFKTVYDSVRSKTIHTEKKPQELSWVLAALALAVLGLNGLLQVFWIRRL